MLRELNIWKNLKWIDAVDLNKDEIIRILEPYEVHELDIEASLEGNQKARIDVYDDYLEESTYLKKYIPILENENSINVPVKVEDVKIDINKEVSTINQNEIVKDKKDIKEETIISIDNSNKLENINTQDYKQETPKEIVLDEKTAREKVLEYENKIKSNEEKEEKIAEKKEVSNKKYNYRKALGLKIKK